MSKLQNDRTAAYRKSLGLDPGIPIGPKNKEVRNLMRSVKMDVLSRDGFRCVICSSHGVRFHVHHIEPFADNFEGRLDRENLVTLCRDCHFNIVHAGNFRKKPNPVISAVLKGYIFWQCSDCGASHDRDVNSASNILRIGQERLPLVGEIPVL